MTKLQEGVKIYKTAYATTKRQRRKIFFFKKNKF